MVNKLFEANSNLNTDVMVSKVKTNREYLLSKNIRSEFNTYTSFRPFRTFNDAYAVDYDENGNEISNDGIGTPGVRSLFNKAGAVILGTDDVHEAGEVVNKTASWWRISNNVPLIDNRSTRLAIKKISGCTVKELVTASQNGLLGRETYSYSDFMFCKHLGKVSNNYLITLRRFPYPVDDFISSVHINQDKGYATTNTDSIGCLVTWMGTPGNEMSNILKYSVSMPFEQVSAQMQDRNAGADDGGGPVNAVAALFDKTYRQQYRDGGAGTILQRYTNNFFPKWMQQGEPPYPASQWSTFQDNAKAYGPIDVIKDTYKRGENGLQFNQDISITFDYELRSYNGINPRQAMLDLLANILNVTYNTGTFWGGGFRGYGAHQSNIFTNLQIYKSQGGFTSFIDSFHQDVKTIEKNIKDSIKSQGGLLQTIKSFANELGGMVLAGILNNVGRPNKQTTNSFLSPAPVGFWHLTIGNPHHPIMSIGNMILKNTTIEHYGPLGLDDFPTGLKVTCELTRGKTRDIRDIEKIYMHGNDRIYSPMGPKIFDMYKNSQEYIHDYKHNNDFIGDADDNIIIGSGADKLEINIDDMNKMKNVLQKYFGHVDTNSIAIASMEQEMGASGKKKKGTAGGDSSVQGNK